MIRLVFFVIVFLSLLGLQGHRAIAQSSNLAEEVVSPAIEIPSDDITYGKFTENSSTMFVRGTHAVWLKDENKMKVYLTPSKITDEEKLKIENGDSAFFIFLNKELPKKWEWYPHVVIELTFNSEEINSKNLNSFYIIAYGIERESQTININSFPSDSQRFEKISFNEGILSIEFVGKTSIMESSFSWNIKI